MQVKDVKPWTTVAIKGIVVEQKGNQSLLYVPGVGQTGLWSVVNSADCVIVSESDPMISSAIAAVFARERSNAREED